MKSFSISIILLLGLSVSAWATKPPIKFGKVTEEELNMTVYEHDSSAAAVVLCDYGVLNKETYIFTRTIRIKILRKEGLYLASGIYPGYEKNDIRGKTYNIENGEIVENKLKNESIFTERIFDNYYDLRIAMPNVKVGSVFEIKIAHFLPPKVWYFQRDIPVLHSELLLPDIENFDFQMRFTGYETLDINEPDRWVARKVPAFKAEPYINSKYNYITKFDIDIKNFEIPGYYYKSFAEDWSTVARLLDESSFFGKNLGVATYLGRIAKEIKESELSDEGRLNAAYEAIKVVKWNNKERLFTSKEGVLGETFREKTGNSADINLLLVNLLNKLDIEANPIVLSTRDNGTISEMYPTIFKLNYVIAYAKIGDKEYFLDATEENLPLGMLPERCLNGLAHVIVESEAYPITIRPSYIYKKTEMLSLDLKPDLSLHGSLIAKHEAYSGFEFRKDYEKYNSKEAFVKSIEDSYSGLKLKDYSITNLKENNLPITVESELSIENVVFELDDKLYLNPLLHLKMNENPFKIEKRLYPVDYAMPKSVLYTLNITLPEGYIVDELPKPLKLTLPERAASLFYNISVLGNKISVTYKLDINKPVFYVSEYQMLKEFYSQLIEKHAEPIIISKS